jgi:hypothetical protein
VVANFERPLSTTTVPTPVALAPMLIKGGNGGMRGVDASMTLTLPPLVMVSDPMPDSPTRRLPEARKIESESTSTLPMPLASRPMLM